MTIRNRGAFSLAPIVAGVLFSGCAEPSTPGVPGVSARAWMQPGATQEALLYVADTKDDRVDVYTYPAMQLAGTLTGFAGLAFLCADKAGNVFIPSYGLSKIFKYNHGGTTPIETLKDPRSAPYSCSVDPSTGDLAVANFSVDYAKTGDLAIYHHAKGKPHVYMPYAVTHEYFCTYDDSGDLFVENASPAASGGYFALEELRKGGRLFEPVGLQNVPAYPNGLQWEGSYLAVGTGSIAGPSSGDTYIYHVQMSGSIGKTIGVTKLQERAPTGNFFIDGSTIIVSGGESQSNLGFFSYPGGGKATNTFAETSPYGVVVSAAAH
jgi:hypothetical protein